MAASFYFYDLETSGVSARSARIMQFAGQRTDMSLKPIGEPHNILIKLHDDILPEPDAVMITGITPQKTLSDGVSEPEFLDTFFAEVATPGTIFVGFNSIRFDDEFMRHTLWRNFYDAYEWQWQDDRSRWDMLDVVRMTRALRPDGIEWPFAGDGAPTNRLELLTKLNGLEHANAHDALSDVRATIAVAKLIQQKQPKLFDWLLTHRGKRDVAKVIDGGEPFVYTSGRYPSEYEKTTVAVKIADHPNKTGALVYDLRKNPDNFTGKTPEQLAKMWSTRYDDSKDAFPVKKLQQNRCPAIAPLGVLDDASRTRTHIDLDTMQNHLSKLRKNQALVSAITKAAELTDKQFQASFIKDTTDVDGALYDGFVQDSDKRTMAKLRKSSADQLAEFADKFDDQRLRQMVPLYKARNFASALSPDERSAWEQHRTQKLMAGDQKSRAAKYFARLAELAQTHANDPSKQYLLEELQLYGQNILPYTN